jgi:superfamily II DNA or RNA helicase
MSDLTIHKVNEVWNQVLSSDLGIRQELAEYFTFKVPGFMFMPAYKNKMWDGNIRLYNTMTGHLYAGLMHHVEKFAKDRRYKLSYEYDNSAEQFSVVEAKEFLSQQKFSMKPYDYQIKAFIDAIRYNRQLFLSPTASGKSFIIYMILRWYLMPTLIIVPTTGLVHQMYSDFKEYGFNSEKYCHKIFAGQSKKTDKPVVITTWQSIYKMRRDFFDKFSVIIGDEAHLFKARSLTGIMEKTDNIKYRFGFTGTLDDSKTHKLVLEGLFGKCNHVITTKELMDQKKVADLNIKIICLGYREEIRKVVSRADYQDEIDFIVGYEPRNNFLKNLAVSLEGNTLLLFNYVDKHGKVLYNSIQDIVDKVDKDRKLYFIHGAIKGEDRDDIRHIVEKETNAIVVASYGTFSTGVNIKNLDNIIFASPTKSRIRNLQSIGRSLRTSDRKSNATLYDVADDLSWKKKQNYTLKHLIERVKIYDSEKFKYKLYTVKVK